MLGWACPGLLHRQKGSQPSAHPAECPLIEESNPEERNAANNEDTAPAFPSPQQSISQTVKSMLRMLYTNSVAPAWVIAY